MTISNCVFVFYWCQQFSEIEEKTGQASYSSTTPDFIFEVEYSETNTLNAKFNELSQIHDVWYAYHGSRVDNFHSILNNGLHAHLNKVSLTSWLTDSDWLSVCLTDWLTDWLNDWLIVCLSVCLTDWCFLPCLVDVSMDWLTVLYFM